MTTEEARRILGVKSGCEGAALRTAFNAAVKSSHPDSGGSEEAFRLTVEAYRFLEGRTDADAASHTASEREAALERLDITPSLAMVGGRVLTRLVDGRRVAITLPPGLRQGDRISAKGSILSIIIKGRPDLFVSGDDLCMVVKTNEEIMRDGGRVKIKTPSGSRMLWVSRQTGTNHIVRIPGQGLPATRTHAQGAMVIKLVPDKAAKPKSKAEVKRKGFASAWGKSA